MIGFLLSDGRKEIVHFDKITSRIQKLMYNLNTEFVDPVSIHRIPSSFHFKCFVSICERPLLLLKSPNNLLGFNLMTLIRQFNYCYVLPNLHDFFLLFTLFQ